MVQLPAIASSPPPLARLRRYAGPERRVARDEFSSALARMLDEIDYGMCLLDDKGTVLHANHAAHRVMAGDHPLNMASGQLVASHPGDATALRNGLRHAVQRSQRGLITLGTAARRVSLSLIPISGTTALVVLGRQGICETLTIQSFARCHDLTHAEGQVLESLCRGGRPADIAEGLGVAVSTVRTQICAIRAKTGSSSIGDLVCRVATLPPIVNALRGYRSCATAMDPLQVA
jgi:DNA-binding CsgD family transcriptional regulator